MSDGRERILGRVKAALAPLPRRAAYPEFPDDLAVMQALVAGRVPAELFAERIKLVNGLALGSAEELAAWLREHGHRRGYCDPALWTQLAPALGGLEVSIEYDRTRVDDFSFGITLAAGAIAETGTIVLNDAVTSRRLAALAPWVHVAVVRRAEVFPHLAAAVAALGRDPNVIWCTGPSKTADVEGILIEGVHGPGVQIALLVD